MPSTVEDMEKIFPVHQIAKLMDKKPELLTTCTYIYVSVESFSPRIAQFRSFSVERAGVVKSQFNLIVFFFHFVIQMNRIYYPKARSRLNVHF